MTHFDPEAPIPSLDPSTIVDTSIMPQVIHSTLNFFLNTFRITNLMETFDSFRNSKGFEYTFSFFSHFISTLHSIIHSFYSFLHPLYTTCKEFLLKWLQFTHYSHFTHFTHFKAFFLTFFKKNSFLQGLWNRSIFATLSNLYEDFFFSRFKSLNLENVISNHHLVLFILFSPFIVLVLITTVIILISFMMRCFSLFGNCFNCCWWQRRSYAYEKNQDDLQDFDENDMEVHLHVEEKYNRGIGFEKLNGREIHHICSYLDAPDLMRVSQVSLQWVQPSRSTYLWSNLFCRWKPSTFDQVSKILYYRLLKQYFNPKYIIVNAFGMESFCSSIHFHSNFATRNKLTRVMFYEGGARYPTVFDCRNRNHLLYNCVIRDDTGLELHWRNNDMKDEWSIVIYHDPHLGRMRLEGVRFYEGVEIPIRATASLS